MVDRTEILLRVLLDREVWGLGRLLEDSPECYLIVTQKLKKAETAVVPA